MLADVRSYPLGFTCVLRRLSAMIVPATNGTLPEIRVILRDEYRLSIKWNRKHGCPML